MSDRLWRPVQVSFKNYQISVFPGATTSVRRRVVCSAKQIRTKGYTEDNDDSDHWEDEASWWDELAPLVAPEKKTPDSPSRTQKPPSTNLLHGPRLQSGQFNCTQDWRAFRARLVALEQADSLFLPWPCATLSDQCIADGCYQDWSQMQQQNPVAADIIIASSSANISMFDPAATVMPASNSQQQQQQMRPHGASHCQASSSSASLPTSSTTTTNLTPNSKDQGAKKPAHHHPPSFNSALSCRRELVEDLCVKQEENSSNVSQQKDHQHSLDACSNTQRENGPASPSNTHRENGPASPSNTQRENGPASPCKSSSPSPRSLQRRRQHDGPVQSTDITCRHNSRPEHKHDPSRSQTAFSQGPKQKPVPRGRAGSGIKQHQHQHHHQQQHHAYKQHQSPHHEGRQFNRHISQQTRHLPCTVSQRRHVLLGAGPASWAHMLTHPEPGCLLLSKASPDGAFFDRTVILVTSHDEVRGSVGFVLNKPSPMKVCELRLATDCPGFTDSFGSQKLLIGGPSHLDHVTVLHRYLGLSGSHQVGDRLFTGGLPDAVRLVQAGLAMPHEFSLMLGVSGWTPRQLVSEIEKGNWYCVAASPDLVLPRRAPSSSLGDGMAVREGQDMWSRILAIASGPDAVPKWHF
ncbi:hypothetical protein CEUSTIGMA_g10550.t1 [Chlamydomonas eustigma]|uniref:YqgE/AlgH family protein n=1 Tax=Chlamydomonas eustigma TaxID=1157962 RepID=A0A250XJ70_9CHLO|nr:hypothetical protein CEUSTIGMA_g10550.t1 [Chlamydomonas eustigma]|eukprot:GAX83124.1 hypothetical protein CEUSTIGMA_g10550.t1 [Chlamydomonas eustigma]